MSSAVTTIYIALFGLALGSFANVLIARVPNGHSINGRSQCPDCGHVLSAADLIPIISWIWLRGECRYCGSTISRVYPLVEVVTAAMMVVTWFHFDAIFLKLAWIAFVLIGIALAVIDLKTFRLPNPLVLAGLMFGLLLLSFDAVQDARGSSIRTAVIGAVALFAFYLAIRIFSRGGMGLGDVKLAAVIGLYLGYLGWSYLLVGTFLGFLLGAFVGLALIAAGSANRKTPIPYGPFMLVGAWLALWLAPTLSGFVLQ